MINILLLSPHTEARFVAEMLSAGASAYLPKKCAARELVQAVRTVKEGRTYLSPEVTGDVLRGDRPLMDQGR